MSPSFSVVAPVPLNPETLAQKVRRLQAEARALAKDHVRQMTASMAELQSLAAEISEGGDVYSPGARDIARRLAEDLDARIQTLDAIQARAS